MLEYIPLQGRIARLEPLTPDHHDGLCEAIVDGQLWELFVTRVPCSENIGKFIQQAAVDFEAGTSLAFAIVDAQSDKVVGSTRFMKANPANKRLEIGYTFIAASHQKSGINTESKLLMLTHAFEHLAVNRVEFLTDYLNFKSRKAILGLGAKEEGILRNHMVMPDGRVRDSALYSIIANEWAGVKQNLQNKLR